jgi:hypothetical protein
LNPGSYTVVVYAGAEYEVARERVYIDTEGTNDRRGNTLPPISRLYTVQISLQLKRANPAQTGVVNAAVVGIPFGARHLYQKALESAKRGAQTPTKPVRKVTSTLYKLYKAYAWSAKSLSKFHGIRSAPRLKSRLSSIYKDGSEKAIGDVGAATFTQTNCTEV